MIGGFRGEVLVSGWRMLAWLLCSGVVVLLSRVLYFAFLFGFGWGGFWLVWVL